MDSITKTAGHADTPAPSPFGSVLAVNRSQTQVEVPTALTLSQNGDAWRAWTAGLPTLAQEFLDRWSLRLDGPPAHGAVALVLPVLQADSSPAVLKLQPVDEETRDEPFALRVWGGRHAVALLNTAPDSGVMLLERLDAARSLATVPDATAALQHLAELLKQLAVVPASDGFRPLADIARAMLDRVPTYSRSLADPTERRLLATCAAAMGELLDEPGDRLLHWDLHYDNVLAPLPSLPVSGRGPWLAIDPKPLAGDPCFELLPALRNRSDDVVCTADVPGAIRHRFHLMTEVVGLDRERATGWTLGRVLQGCLWDIEDGAVTLQPELKAIAQALLAS
ncbi:aminoglycoside phosphotransferase family protein [Streptomyces sp. NPDC018036]|uniref:aminoglycoside phosphotransferase family protein n=1 Tax=Streptomyces sp. NPDC018036 TaxID=3365035 RepID=UPI00378755E1